MKKSHLVSAVLAFILLIIHASATVAGIFSVSSISITPAIYVFSAGLLGLIGISRRK